MIEYYLDNSSTTKINDDVLDEMINVYKNKYGNPSSLHSLGLRAEKMIKKAKFSIGKFINAGENEIFFTSGGTESNNIVISNALKLAKKNSNIVISEFEHPSVYETAYQKNDNNIEIRVVKINDDGYVNESDFANKVDENTVLVSVMLVNNELGSIQNIAELCRKSKLINKDLLFHTDAVQAYGKMKINVRALGIDFMTFSSHKINGPQGVGGLYMRKDLTLIPLMFGGKQEKAIRPGTENLAGIVGFAKATEIIDDKFEEYVLHIKNIRDDFARKFIDKIENIKVNSDICGAPHIFNVSIDGIRSEVLLHYLEMKNIFISTGTTCSSKAKKENRVLTSIGLNADQIQSTIRLSFGVNNNLEDNDYLIDEFSSIINEIRKIMK